MSTMEDGPASIERGPFTPKMNAEMWARWARGSAIRASMARTSAVAFVREEINYLSARAIDNGVARPVVVVRDDVDAAGLVLDAHFIGSIMDGKCRSPYGVTHSPYLAFAMPASELAEVAHHCVTIPGDVIDQIHAYEPTPNTVGVLVLMHGGASFVETVREPWVEPQALEAWKRDAAGELVRVA